MSSNFLLQTLQCFKRFKKRLSMKTLKNYPKRGYFSRISVISEIFPYCLTAQTVEFMFSNVAHRATVCRTGGTTIVSSSRSSFSDVGSESSFGTGSYSVLPKVHNRTLICRFNVQYVYTAPNPRNTQFPLTQFLHKQCFA